MNILVENAYVLHFVWRYIKYIIYKFNLLVNLKYLTLPVIYLVIMFLLVPNVTMEVNVVSYQELDSYNDTITKEDKIEVILDKYNLTMKEFKILRAIVLSEAEANSYEDAYAVINTIYNRTHSKNWVKSVSNKFGKNKGYSLYYQAIHPNQFTVYQSGAYKKNLNNDKSIGNDAIIDFLYEEEIMHNYLSFRSHNIKIKNSESFSKKGNNYFNEIKEENYI